MNQIYDVEPVDVALGMKLLNAYNVLGIPLTCYTVPSVADLFDLRESDIYSMLQSKDLIECMKARFGPDSLLTTINDKDELILPLFKLHNEDKYITLIEESVLLVLCLSLFKLMKPATINIVVAGFLETVVNRVHHTAYKIFEARSHGQDTSEIIGGELSRSAWESLNRQLSKDV